jgi:phosphotransferase system  glucose/maltose/N-acetylglucosamine-specific IIC component
MKRFVKALIFLVAIIIAFWFGTIWGWVDGFDKGFHKGANFMITGGSYGDSTCVVIEGEK